MRKDDRYLKHINGKIRAAVQKYNMIKEGDKIAVGVSGGKDSLVLLYTLSQLKRYYPINFDLIAITADPCFNSLETDYSKIELLCNQLGVPYYIERTQIGDIIFKIRKEKNPCSLCANMRRGVLHSMAKEHGCNSIALGHHLDDAAETLLMNLFINGTLSCFSPVSYLSRRDLYMIRPMIYCEEREIENFSTKFRLPVEKSICPADGITQRQKTKEFLQRMEKEYPNLRHKILGAIEKAHLSNWFE